MSIEPACNFCGASDKYRCKTQEKANQCSSYINQQQSLDEVRKNKMSNEKNQTLAPTNTEKLADLASRQARSVVAVIDALATRGGAFKGEELATIGMLRNQSSEIVQLAETVLSELAK